ncbi:GDSL-like lipase/acylhydrolase family protein [Mumia flava]|uniref:GDSL-like lipase/acylhydrolase family protein n=1 Tax=Mumia flava TaxID=1348852 RepID=A0A0B2B7H1_9ACTN|nr:SGNH/GDSL hydrolase family protein [Mumia flava]PJJ57750.1 GDSL-like lipase/acylhydrolase family protein [Mumia flava]
MDRSSFRVAAAGFAALIVSLVLVPPANAASAERYVALGDSYSAGVGAGSYIASSGDCRRSTKAYPYLWKSSNAPASFTFAACSGATTTSVRTGQLASLATSTSLVSISAGGNDVGFTSVMQTCVLRSQSRCVSAVDNAIAQVDGVLPGRLDSLYAAIRSRAPDAHVVVMGYPRFYKLRGSCIVGLTETERAAINRGADALNAQIAKRAADHGFTFSSVTDEFTGHEICSGDAWLHSVTLPIWKSYHPKAVGQSSGYLPAFRSAA